MRPNPSLNGSANGGADHQTQREIVLGHSLFLLDSRLRIEKPGDLQAAPRKELDKVLHTDGW